MLQRPGAFNNVGILNIRCRSHPRSLALYAETAPDRCLVQNHALGFDTGRSSPQPTPRMFYGVILGPMP
jgi:hypothetical protein